MRKNRRKKATSQKCECPGCIIAKLVDEIQDRLLEMAALESQFTNAPPDPRFIEIRDALVTLGDNLLSNIANIQAENEIGVPFFEGTPEFMAIITGKKYH